MDMKVYLSDEEGEFVRKQPKGYLRMIVQRFMKTEGALTAEELQFLRDHGGTHGVIRMARGLAGKPQAYDPETGEIVAKEEE